MTFVVRGARPEDAPDIARMAYATGFFGAPAGGYFPDEGLFAALWVGPYLHAGEAAVGFVAERQGRPVGYILGTSSFAAYRAGMRACAPRLLAGVLGGRYRRFRGCLPYLQRAVRYATPHASELTYPAHLHLNLLAQARGLGAGSALLDAYLMALRTRGVQGVQLSTTDQNVAALRLYRSRGFETVSAHVTPLWRPWLGADATHLVLGRTLT